MEEALVHRLLSFRSSMKEPYEKSGLTNPGQNVDLESIEDLAKGENKRKPVIIMTFGPTGAGKTGLAKKAAEYEKINYEDCVLTLVDDLVENDSVYKRKIDEIIKKYDLENKPQLLSYPSDELFQAFGEAYVASRFQMGCRDIKPDDDSINHYSSKIGEITTWSCNKQNDMKLFRAIDEGKNIIFETTGASVRDGNFAKNDYGWLYTTVKPKYRIVAAFATVTFCELVRRNKTRAVDELEMYIKNRNGPAPRLPDVIDDNDKSIYRKLTTLIIEVMKDITQDCLTAECSRNVSCSCPFDSILIYNNNGNKLQLVLEFNKIEPFDVEQKKHELTNILGTLMRIPKEVCKT